MSYEARSRRGQIARARSLARQVIAGYPIEVARMRVIAHEFNTTFRVDASDGRRFALRCNIGSPRSAANVRAEVAWLEALARDTALLVPVPIRRADGDVVTVIDFPDLGVPVCAVLCSWLEGRDIEEPSALQAGEMGRAAALVHEHGVGFVAPDGAAFPFGAGLFMNSRDHLRGDHRDLSDEAHVVVDEARTRIERAFGELASHDAQPIHGDLHPSNVKWHGGRLAVFDFDDSVIGHPVQDLAVSAYYLRDDAALEAAFKDGYASVRALPACTDEQFEALVAGRNLLLLNDLLVSVSAHLIALRPRYVANTVAKLRYWMDTGRYRHDVPGLVT